MKKRLNKAIEFLLARGNLPILYWLKKDILEVPIEREYKNLKKYAARIRIINEQKLDGSWCQKKYENNPKWEKTHYFIETLRNSFILYDYGCSGKSKEVKKLANFFFSTQSREGDFRGVYPNEYAPHYHALTLEILCQFGMDENKNVQKGYRWLIKNRQDDGGWATPYQTISEKDLKKRYELNPEKRLSPIKGDKSQPYSHLVTGIVLRALTASQIWINRKYTKTAGELILKRFYKKDKYEERKSADYWKELSYPFWSTNLLSSLDSLSKLDYTTENDKIKNALEWLLKVQLPQGFWKSGYKGADLEDHLWVTLSVLRVFKGFGFIES
jgi:prenyltransferase beta subunit